MNPAKTNRKHTRNKNALPIGRKTKKNGFLIRRQQPITDTGKATTGPPTHDIVTLWGAGNIA